MSNESNFTKQQHLISPKNDVVFQILFGEVGSENITKNFLEAVLDEHISKIDLSKNPVLRNIVPGKKKGILDVIAEINGKEKCNIEMQVGKERRYNTKNIILLVTNLYKRHKRGRKLR